MEECALEFLVNHHQLFGKETYPLKKAFLIPYEDKRPFFPKVKKKARDEMTGLA